ncbi:MAG: 3-dehydroquinate synthase family protein, partial [Terrimicrobiaceae bacterium]
AGYGRYLHGEAISLGLAAALYLSVKKAGFPPADAERVLRILRAFNLPIRLPADLSTEALMTALSHDKKFQAGAIRYILSEKPGSAFVSKDITADDLRAAIESIRE